MPTAHVQLISGVLRVFADGRQFGDAYEWAATIQRVDDETMEILGVDKRPTISGIRAIVTELRRMGVKRLVHKEADGRNKVFEL